MADAGEEALNKVAMEGEAAAAGDKAADSLGGINVRCDFRSNEEQNETDELWQNWVRTVPSFAIGRTLGRVVLK